MRVEDYTAQELFNQLNDTDEFESLEAKSLSKDSMRSVLETVCSFSNEPNLGGGVILLGVAENDKEGPRYVVDGVGDTDKVQLDLATQCKTIFNKPLYPSVKVEKVEGRNVLRIVVPELPLGEKPLYFKKDSLPHGAFRRVGSSDLHCTGEDISELFADPSESYDATPVRGATLDDVDPLAVKRYRDLRKEVNPAAEELNYETDELLESLQCVNADNPKQLNVAGLLLFGTQKALRKFMPMARVDYIRVPGTEWVADPDESFRSIDMRDSLLRLTYRLIDAVSADLPKGFLLKDKPQADSVGLPFKVLREAIVNALMHGSYREGRPIQVIRYDNRIEIVNAGYSLKPEELLGTPGSVPRNRVLCPVFHDTNLAETKGTGIKRMCKLMASAHLASPTCESNREGNQFTLRLLLHHFLGEEDLAWLAKFSRFDLDDRQKKALIFLRESGAVDNSVCRQLSGCDILQASMALRKMRDLGLLVQKGKARATYYEPGPEMLKSLERLDPPVEGSSPSLVHNDGDLVYKGVSLVHKNLTLVDKEMLMLITKDIRPRMKGGEIEVIIAKICAISSFTRQELALFVGRNETYVKHILARMIKAGYLVYAIPEMSTNPHQAYKTLRNPGSKPIQGALDL